MAVSIVGSNPPRNVGFYTSTIVKLDNSYLEGGEPLSAAQLGLAVVDEAICFPTNGSEAEATAVGEIRYSTSAEKLIVMDYKTQKEMAKEKDLSKVLVRVVAFGKARAK